MKTVLFDIDGTLADIEHRRHYVEGDRQNWTAFFEEMGADTVNAPVVDLYNVLWAHADYECIVLSGRPDNFRVLTETWFAWNEIPFSRIEMRGAKDNRRDDVVKQEILDKLLAEGKEIAFVVDDRQQVVDMWRANGIICFQCDVGNF
jgi:phosphoglycolate phosphatase-like HAD superfamily hydrolase